MLHLLQRLQLLHLSVLLLLLLVVAGCRPADRLARHWLEYHRAEHHADGPRQDPQSATIDLYHFSDYHSHALPAFAEGEANRGGIAQLIGLLKSAKADNPDALIFSGGDMMNLNNPIWSDLYTCTEWSWFNGLLDGMALGNHELDYGPAHFTACANSIVYPILSSGLIYSETVTAVLPEYWVYPVAGARVGVFAVAGEDYPRIVQPDLLPAGTRWRTGAEKLARVAEIVDLLQHEEDADIIISIGHQSRAEDEAMAQSVPGIDLILGTHSHLKVPLTQIEGTETYYISPFQYLGYVSHVELQVVAGELVDVAGELIAINATTPADALLAAKVASMQATLEERHPERFEVLGEAATLIDNSDINLGETGIGNFVTDLAREAVEAHLFLSTSSSFRAALPPGPITREDYLTALPYANTIVTAEMTGAELAQLLALSASKRGSDAFSQISGVRFTLKSSDNSISDIEVIDDPSDPAAIYSAIDPEATYRVATTNFQALIAADYKELFAAAENVTNTEIEINELVLEYIRENSPIRASTDGRITLTD